MYLANHFFDYRKDSGELYIYLPFCGHAFRMGPWEKGCRVEAECPISGWRSADGEIDLPIALPRLTAGDDTHAVYKYLLTLPKNVVDKMSGFPLGQISMLQLCAMTPRAGQLLEANKMFFWLLASILLDIWDYDKRAIHSVLGWTQDALLRLIWKTADKRSVQFLKKLEPYCEPVYLSESWLEVLISNPITFDLTVRHTSLDWKYLALLYAHQDDLVYPSCIQLFQKKQEISALSSGLNEWKRLIEDCRGIATHLGYKNWDAELKKCKTVKQITKFHNCWTDELNKRAEESTLLFPPPPFPGTNYIQPITSLGNLYREGREMRHCVASYAEIIMEGVSYIYKVLSPERATLEIRKTEQGLWCLVQIKRVHNQMVNEETLSAVESWLASCQKVSGLNRG